MANLGEHQTRSAPDVTASGVSSLNHLRNFQTDVWRPLGVFLLMLAFWEVAAQAGLISPIFFPAPSRIGQSAVKLLAEGILLEGLGITLARWFIGLLIGGLFGLIFGLLMGWFSPFHTFMKPFIAAFHPMPKIAILPLIMVVFGIGETSKLIVIMTASFLPVLLNTLTGVEQTQTAYFDLARNYGAGRRQMIWRVLLPASLPSILTGFLLAANLALLVTIAVEIVSASRGLGAMIWLSWEIMRTVDLYAVLSTIVIMGVLIHGLFYVLRRLLVPWQEENV